MSRSFYIYTHHQIMSVSRLVYIFFLLIAVSFSSSAQQGRIDSLLASLKNTEDDTVKVNTFTELSREYSYISKYEKALEYGQKALKLSEETDYKKGLGTALHVVGNVYNFQGDVNKALDHYLRSVKVKEITGDKRGLSASLSNLGIVYMDRGDYPKALEFYLKALKMDKETGDKKGMAMSLSNVGVMYMNEKNLPKALEYLLPALAMAKEVNNEVGVAGTLNNLGSVYFWNHDYKKGMECYFEGMKIQEKYDDKNGLANTYDCIGTAYEQEGNLEKALEYHRKAFDLNQEIGDKNGMVGALHNIAGIYLDKKDYPSALENVNKSMLLAKETGSMQYLMYNNKLLSDIYTKMNQPQKALEHYIIYSDIKDSILNDEGNKHIAEMSAQYDSEKKDNEIQLLNKEKEKQVAVNAEESKKQKIITGSISVVLLMVLLFSLFVLRSNRQKQKANIEITKQKEIIEERNREVRDSITYAQRIQNAILPPNKFVKECLPDSFVLLKPKDIVSGDIFWIEKVNNYILFAAVDCTGHGVPGAMVSVVGHNALNRCVKEFGLTQPAEILNKLTLLVEETFSKNESEVKDGMDISLCCLDTSTNVLGWAGANNPVWINKKGKMEIIKADKQPIGVFAYRKPFTNHVVQLYKGDAIYIFTDGFADQFGGPNGKKFKYKQMEEILMYSNHKSMEEQKMIIDNSFETWRKELEQIDDVCIIGVRIS